MCDKRFMFYHTGNDMIQDFMKRNYRKFRNITCALIVGISVAGSTNIVYADTRPGGCDDGIDVLREAGLLDEAIADGTVSSEAAARAGVTESGTSASPASNTPTESSSNSSESAAPATVETPSGSTTAATSKQEKKKTEVTITESEVSGKFVTTSAVDLYDTNKKSNKVSALDAGTIVSITAETSNGLFKTEDGYYFDKTKCVTVDEWEAGWQETERTDATCTDAGSVTYNNVNNTEITKTDEIPALGHSYDVTDTKEPTCTEKGSTTYTCGRCGDTYIEETDALGHQEGDWTIVKEPRLFSKGEKVIKCTVCGEVLKTETVEQTCPLPLPAVIGIGAGLGAIIAGIVVWLKKKKN